MFKHQKNWFIHNISKGLSLFIQQILIFYNLVSFQSILGVYFYLDRIESPALGSIGWLPLVSLIVYFFCYEAGNNSQIIETWYLTKYLIIVWRCDLWQSMQF